MTRIKLAEFVLYKKEVLANLKKAQGLLNKINIERKTIVENRRNAGISHKPIGGTIKNYITDIEDREFKVKERQVIKNLISDLTKNANELESRLL